MRGREKKEKRRVRVCVITSHGSSDMHVVSPAYGIYTYTYMYMHNTVGKKSQCIHHCPRRNVADVLKASLYENREKNSVHGRTEIAGRSPRNLRQEGEWGRTGLAGEEGSWGFAVWDLDVLESFAGEKKKV